MEPELEKLTLEVFGQMVRDLDSSRVLEKQHCIREKQHCMSDVFALALIRAKQLLSEKIPSKDG